MNIDSKKTEDLKIDKGHRGGRCTEDHLFCKNRKCHEKPPNTHSRLPPTGSSQDQNDIPQCSSVLH